MKVETLTGIDLDGAVAALEGTDAILNMMTEPRGFRPSTDWAQGGPIIEREEMELYVYEHAEPGKQARWAAKKYFETDPFMEQHGPTPLIDAMRCYVKSRIGVRRKE
jgi:hypothetical protein